MFLLARRADQTGRHLYEERITLWKAADIDQAIELAEDEAKVYAGEEDKYLGLAQGYAIYDDITNEGVEVFSLLRDCDLEPDDYLSAFFDTGGERSR